MKVSLKLMITLLAILRPYTMMSVHSFDPVANQQGKIYEALPKAVQKSGKFVTLHVPKSPQPSTAQIIYFYKVAGTKQTHGGMMQIVQFQPNQIVKTVHILPPANPKDASITINAMPKTTWNLHVQTTQAEAIKNPTAAQKASGKTLNTKNMASPLYHLHLKYSKIKPNQVITLKVPATKAPTTKKEAVKLATAKTISKKPTKQIQKTDSLWSDIKKDLSEVEQEVENLVSTL
ncbi:MAG: hypothetical protein NTZ68_02165 [Candidatus Dependentiae bacterium]|nr:hypothetical protein [Candidatus Dependentiae bacterium]